VLINKGHFFENIPKQLSLELEIIFYLSNTIIKNKSIRSLEFPFIIVLYGFDRSHQFFKNYRLILVRCLVAEEK